MSFASLPGRVAGIMRDALGVLALLGPKGVVPGPVLVAISWCIQRRLKRFERLMARVAAGRPAVTRRVSSRSGVAGDVGEEDSSGGANHLDPLPRGEGEVGRRRVFLVPRGFAWAVKMAQGTAVFGSQLQALLMEPEVVALLHRVPEAGAMLRPLCRMLAVTFPEGLMPETMQGPSKTPKPKRRRHPPGWYPGHENNPGPKAVREKWERVFAEERAGQARAPPRRRAIMDAIATVQAAR